MEWRLLGAEKEPGCIVARRQAGESNVMLWAMLLGSDMHVDVILTHTTYNVEDQVDSFMAAVFPNGNVLLQKNDVPKSFEECKSVVDLQIH